MLGLTGATCALLLTIIAAAPLQQQHDYTTERSQYRRSGPVTCPGPYANPTKCSDPKPVCCQMREDIWTCIGTDDVCCAQSLSHGYGAVCTGAHQQCCWGFSGPTCYNNSTQICCSGNFATACPKNNTCGGSNMDPQCVKPPTPVDCNDKYKTQASCDADAECSWCTSAAVPAACNTLADAKSLPPTVFTCDKV